MFVVLNAEFCILIQKMFIKYVMVDVRTKYK
jgi:hypothetical protein